MTSKVKNLVGGSGNDGVLGGLGSDTVLGSSGNDFVFGEKGSDRAVAGGEGHDILIGDHVPAVKDIVSCGGGFDRVLADSKDVVADDCEKVRVVHGTKAEVLKQEDAFFKSLPPAMRKFFDTLFEEQLAPVPNG